MSQNTNATSTQWVTRTNSVYNEEHPSLTESDLMTFIHALPQLPDTQKLAISLQIADLLQSLHSDHSTIIASLLYPVFNQLDTKQMASFTKYCPTSLLKLVRGVTQLNAQEDLLTSRTLNHQQIDNLRKMLLAIVDDFRVVIIKLVEQAILLKFALAQPTPLPKQQQLAQTVLSLYAPLANRLGIGQLKSMLEDLAFKLLSPNTHATISHSLKLKADKSEHYILSMRQKLTTLLNQAHMKQYQIFGRAKHIYSIYRKMQHKKVDIDGIFDTLAFRILVDTLKDCYTALSLIHQRWAPITQEFKDYIAKPKSNGYRSIHTIVRGPNNILVEIQIRTFDMHAEAELGVAAHWQYKEKKGEPAQSDYEQKINLLRKMLAWQRQLSRHHTQHETVLTDIFKDRVYVFSPKGDVYDLEAGATPLDFAYRIHTDIGHHCRGAKVNGQLVPLTHPLHTGDRIDILTAQQHQPSRDWLNSNLGYLKTKHAQQKVRLWFRKAQYEHNLAQGQLIWEKFAKRNGLNKTHLDLIYASLNYKNTDDLVAGLGIGKISCMALLSQIKAKTEKNNKPATPAAISSMRIHIVKPSETGHESASKTEILVEGNNGIVSKLAKCCYPTPGNNIAGFITSRRGITIHRQDCPYLHNMKTKYIHKIIQVEWLTRKQEETYE